MPKNDAKARKLIHAGSMLAIGLAVGGIAYDLYVLATHHLTPVHRVSNIIALVTFIAVGSSAIAIYREAVAHRGSDDRVKAGE